jgi:hypothetical protein
MARHTDITATGLPVYFAHPHSPWDNTGNLGSSDDVDQIWWRLDEVPVDGFLGGERGAVGAAYDAGVVPATALVEPFKQLSDRLSGGAA